MGASVGTGPGVRGPLAGLLRQTGGIVVGKRRSEKQKQRKKGRIFLAF